MVVQISLLKTKILAISRVFDIATF